MNTKITLLSILLVILGLACAPSYTLVSKRSVKNDFVLVNEDLGIYCAKYEVTNEDYRFFLNDLKEKDAKEYEKCRIDSMGWQMSNQELAFMGKTYSSHPAFDQYPVVNISQYGAAKYCAWLTENTKNQSMKFRLPTETEFRTLMESIPIEIYSNHASDYFCPSFNLYYEGDPAIDGCRTTCHAKQSLYNKSTHFQQRDDGLFHVIGNVSEYIDDGRSMGASWNSLPSEIENIDTVDVPDPLTGFRVWYEIVKH